MSESRDARVDAAIAEYLAACDAGSPPPREAFLARYPDLANSLTAFLDDHERMRQAADPDATLAPPGEVAPLGSIRYVGDYELLAEIARGGMGVVYRARQVSVNRVVAVKMILAGTFADAGDIQRFRVEAEAAANLDHPHILPIYEVGEHEGRPYFSMKLAEGGSLAGRIDKLTARESVTLMAKLARAVHFAHQRGILHRDLKPANVLLDANGEPLIADFGLAKQLQASPQSHLGEVTQTGAIVGTPSYMPPEQARAEKGISTAADVYSLGAILYECLTGRPPFREASVMETLLAVVNQEPIPPTNTDADLAIIAMKCLRKEPRERYTSAAELADDLERWLRGEPIQARPVGTIERATKWVRRNPVVATLTAALLLLLVGITVAAVVTAGRMAILVDQANEESQRAGRQERTARHNLYLAQMGQAHLAWNDGQVGRVRDLLAAQVPQSGSDDFRDFEWRYMDRLCTASHAVVVRTAIPAAAVASGPEGTPIAVTAVSFGPTGTVKPTLTLHDEVSGKILHTLENYQPAGGVKESLAMSPDGSLVAAITADGVRLWESKSGKLQRTLPFKSDRLMSGLAFSPNGQRLVAVSGKSLSIWDVASGTPADLPKLATTALLTSVVFSPDGERVLAGAGIQSGFFPPPTVLGWELKSGKQILAAQHPGGVLAVVVSPDGKTIASGGGDFTIRLWDAETQKQKRVLKGHTNLVSAVVFADEGRRLISGSHDGTLRVWDTDTGTLERTLRGDTLAVTGLALACDGHHVWSSSADGTVRSWTWSQNQECRLLVEPLGPVLSLTFHPDNRHLASGSAGVSLWDVTNGKVVRTFKEPLVNFNVSALAYNRDGSRLATGSVVIKVWDTVTGDKVFGVEPNLFGAAGGNDADDGLIFGLAFDPEGRRIALGGFGLRVRDAASGELLYRNNEAEGFTASVAYSPDGKFLAVGRGMGIDLLDATSHQLLQTLSMPDAVLRVVIASEGNRILAVSNTIARIWEYPSGQELSTFRLAGSQTPTGPGVHTPARAAFSPDGRRLAMAGATGSVGLWDVATGQQILTLPGPGALVTAVAFSRDGYWLAAAGITQNRGILHVWDARPPGAPATNKE